jgi:hypothetical protein
MKKKKFVLRKHGLNPNRQQRFVAYEETLMSECSDIFGVKACTIFTESFNTRRKALRLGWKDETTAYYEDQMQKNNKLNKDSEKDDKLEEELLKASKTSKGSKTVKRSTKTTKTRKGKKLSTSTKIK